MVSTEEKIEIAEAAGASTWCWPTGSRTRSRSSPAGAAWTSCVDPVGGDRFTDSLRSLAPGGRLLVVGFTGGEIPTVKVNRLLLNNVDVIGVGWGAWTGDASGLPGASSGPSWRRCWPPAR